MTKTRQRSTSGAVDPVTAYAKDVIAGKIVAGPYVRASCRRHMKDLKEAGSRGWVFDLDAASRAINFFPDVLRLNGGQFEGKPFELHPSQKFKIGSLFGWKSKTTGLRRFTRFYDEEGKGNGKSPLIAGIGLYCLVADNEERAEVYAAGKDKDQSMVLFRDAVAMVDQSPSLSRRIHKSGINPVWQLSFPKANAFFKPISKEQASSGPRPSCALCDEIHEHKDRDSIDMLERGFKFRLQPLLVMITNSGTDRNSICYEERTHAIKVAEGDVEDDSTFSYVCALDEGDDPLTDPDCWIKANPLLGTVIKKEYLEKAVKQARDIPGKQNGILRLHFCMWTDSVDAWLSRENLEACLSDFDPAQFHGEEVWTGHDLSATTDLTVTACVVEDGFTEDHLPKYAAWITAWTPEETLSEREKTDKQPYNVWVKQKFLNKIPGKTIRLSWPAAHLKELSQQFVLRKAAYDRYAFKLFEKECEELGLEVPFIEHPQGGKRKAKPTEEEVEEAKGQGNDPPEGLWMPGSLTKLENLILEKRIKFLRNPVLVSAIMSAATESDPFNNRWFSKIKATNRIDALIALTMAVGAAVRDGSVTQETSFWETARR